MDIVPKDNNTFPSSRTSSKNVCSLDQELKREALTNCLMIIHTTTDSKHTAAGLY